MSLTDHRFIGPPAVVGQAQVSTADTSLTGARAVVVLRGDPDLYISSLRGKAAVTTTAGMVRWYLQDADGNKRLWREMSVDALTVSATQTSWEEEIVLTEPMALPVGWLILAATHNAEAINVLVMGGKRIASMTTTGVSILG